MAAAWTVHVQISGERAFPVTLADGARAPVAALRAAIAAADATRGLAGVRDARLIAAGHLLADDRVGIEAAGLADGAVVHAVLSARPGAGGVGGGGGAADAPDAPRGFDRLAALGLDADGIALMRSQFLRDVIAADLAEPRNVDGETEAARLLRNEVRAARGRNG